MPRTKFKPMNTLHAIHVAELSLHLGHGDILPCWKQAPSDAPSFSEQANPIVPGVLVLF